MTRSDPRSIGRLLVVEGIDGSGKSSVVRRLAARWRRRGLRVEIFREPSDAALGRTALAVGRREPWNSAMLFSLDRILARPRLQRALGRGSIVLQDRSFYSTLAYQGSRLRGPARERLARLQRRIAVAPSRVLWLDVAPREAIRRVGRRGGPRAPVERERELRRVRESYRRMARAPGWIRLDADRPIREVVDEADRRLEGLVGRRRATRRR